MSSSVSNATMRRLRLGAVVVLLVTEALAALAVLLVVLG